MPQVAVTSQHGAETRTHKRRLSDADEDRQPKRPRDSVTEPCLHAAGYLPSPDTEKAHSIDEWFQTNFDALFSLPPPADVTEPDLSTQWQVELFDFGMPENPPQASVPPIQDDQIVPSAELSALDNLFRSLEGEPFISPPEMTHAPTATSVSDYQGQSELPEPSQPIDWTALLNEDPYEFINDSMFPQSHTHSALPELDLSALQLPQVWTPVAC